MHGFGEHREVRLRRLAKSFRIPFIFKTVNQIPLIGKSDNRYPIAVVLGKRPEGQSKAGADPLLP